MMAQQQNSNALIYASFGRPEDVLQLNARPLAPRKAGKLRVQMLAAPINPSDLIPITGAYSHLIKPPMVAGYEGVGRVIEADHTQSHLIGKRVLPLRADGTWQTHLDCDADIAVPVPDNIPDDLAARAYINPMSARHLLKDWPVNGQSVMLTGAGSLIAALLTRWALEDGAGDVFAVYRSKARKAWLESLGATAIPEDDVASVLSAAQTCGICFDALGGPLATQILNAMQPNTEFVGYGLLTGQPVFPSQTTQATMRRFHLRDRLKDMSPSDWQAEFLALWPRLAGADVPGVEQFDFTDWRSALHAFDRPGRLGKPLLRMPHL